MEEIADGGAFAQKFRIRSNAEREAGLASIDIERAFEFLASIRGNGAFFDDQFRAAAFGCDHARDVFYGAQIGVAVFERGSANADENNAAIADGCCRSGSEFQPPLAHVTLDEKVQVRLEDREFAAVQNLNLRIVIVSACDVMTDLGQTSPGHQSDVTAADYSNLQGCTPTIR